MDRVWKRGDNSFTKGQSRHSWLRKECAKKYIKIKIQNRTSSRTQQTNKQLSIHTAKLGSRWIVNDKSANVLGNNYDVTFQRCYWSVHFCTGNVSFIHEFWWHSIETALNVTFWLTRKFLFRTYRHICCCIPMSSCFKFLSERQSNKMTFHVILTWGYRYLYFLFIFFTFICQKMSASQNLFSSWGLSLKQYTYP